jgi:hypothetical protein
MISVLNISWEFYGRDTVWTLSGTAGAAYVAVGRGIPAVAFSATNSTKRSYKDWNPEDPTDVGESSLEGTRQLYEIILTVCILVVLLGYQLTSMPSWERIWSLRWRTVGKRARWSCRESRITPSDFRQGFCADLAVFIEAPHWG